MRNVLKSIVLLFLLLLFSGCEGKNNGTSNPDYRLVSETHQYPDHGYADLNVTYTYNKNNLVTSSVISRPSSTVQTVVEYESDQQGRIVRQSSYWLEADGTKILNKLITTTYSGNVKQKIMFVEDVDGNGALDYIEIVEFNDKNQVKTISWDQGELGVLYLVDSDSGEVNDYLPLFTSNRKVETESSISDGALDLKASYEYDTDGLVSKRFLNLRLWDVNSSFRYDNSKQLIDINTSFGNAHYQYDHNGRLQYKTIDGNVIGSILQDDYITYGYAYTDEGFLASTQKNTANSTYAYDDHGNMIRMESDFEYLLFSYDFSYGGKGLIRKIGESDYKYALYEMSYDENDNLIRVIYYNNQNLIPTKTSTYTWEKIE